MYKQIQIIPHMQMAQLQRPAKRYDKRRVQRALRAQGPFLRAFV